MHRWKQRQDASTSVCNNYISVVTVPIFSLMVGFGRFLAKKNKRPSTG